MREYPSYEDLGLDPEADRTEDLRPRKSESPEVAASRDSEPTHQQETEKGSSITMLSECLHCGVPTDGTEVCNFCRTYVPPESPAQQLDVAVNRIDILRADLNKVLDSLPSDAPLFGCADLTTGICHLKRASEKINRAAEVLEADEKAVQR